MKYLIEKEQLLYGFEYPEAFKKIVELNLVDFDVWYLFDTERAINRMNGLKQRYPNRKLIPFATRDDCDDIACFDIKQDKKVFIIHDYASIGYEQREEFDNIWEWLRYAIGVMIEYEELEGI